MRLASPCGKIKENQKPTLSTKVGVFYIPERNGKFNIPTSPGPARRREFSGPARTPVDGEIKGKPRDSLDCTVRAYLE